MHTVNVDRLNANITLS